MVRREYILKAAEGQSDKDGLLRIWYSKTQAEKDAESFSEKLGINVNVIWLPNASLQPPMLPWRRMPI